MLRTRFLLWIDLLDGTSFRHNSYFGIDFDLYHIPLSFLSFVLFRYCLSDLCSGSLFALWFPEFCTSIHLFPIWLFSLLLFAILLAVFAFEGRVRVRENV